MLTSRGWWFFLTCLFVLFLALWSNTPGISLLALTLVLWFLGFVAFHVATAAIHIALALALILFVWHMIAGRRTAV